jgi:TonB family protein
MGHWWTDDGVLPRRRPRTPRCRSGSAVRLNAAFWIFHLLFFFGSAPWDAQAQTATEYQVKAAYLYNFAKSAEWRETPQENLSLVIGVVAGDDEFLDSLAKTVAGRKIGNRSILVKRVNSSKEMDFCQVIFFPSNAGRKRTESALAALTSASILLVGEDDGFLKQGGMINLVLRNGKIHFEINKESLGRAGIRLSPELMALADAERGSSGDQAAASSPAASSNSGAPSSSDRPAGPNNPETRRLKVGPQPEYPEIAQRMNIKGAVQLELWVARDGSVKDVKVIGGHPLLAEAFVKVVRGWQYEPSTKESRLIVRYVFGE